MVIKTATAFLVPDQAGYLNFRYHAGPWWRYFDWHFNHSWI